MSDLPLLLEAARAAGVVMLQRRGDVRTRRKADGSPVTDADLAVDALLHEQLIGARPHYGWLSEETTDDLARLKTQRVFVVDPIDGTAAYADGQDDFAVSIAVVDAGRPVAGVIFAPALNQWYVAEAGCGATLNGARLKAAPTDGLRGARLSGGPFGATPFAWAGVVFSPCRSIALRMARVASGVDDATLSPTFKNEWDIAAGVVIGLEAGAAVVDAQGRPLVFNTPAARTPGLVCCAPALEAPILQGLEAQASYSRLRE